MVGIDTLNSLLRGELAATETYQQAMHKAEGSPWDGQLRVIHEDHRKAANRLRLFVREAGGTPKQDSGVWGTFANFVEGTARLFGDTAALKALKEGEESGLGSYETVVEDDDLPPLFREFLVAQLIPQTRQHIRTLDQLIA